MRKTWTRLRLKKNRATAYLVGHIDIRTGLLKRADISSEYPMTQINMGTCQCLFSKERGPDFDTAQRRLRQRCFGAHSNILYFGWLRGFLPKQEDLRGVILKT